MKMAIAATVLAAMSAASLRPAGAANYVVVGVGAHYSCGRWMSSGQEVNNQVGSWIFGYWSGLNNAASLNGKYSMVGQSTDGDGVIGLVRLICSKDPSQLIISATDQAYAQLRSQGR